MPVGPRSDPNRSDPRDPQRADPDLPTRSHTVAAMANTGQTRLKVIDALDHPHGGRILRLRLLEGAPPTVRALRGATLSATGPRGEERRLRVLGFPVTGGKVSDGRIRESGRIDLHIEEEGDGVPVDLTWVVRPA